MSEACRVLDLGVGKGGEYLDGCRREKRMGMDIRGEWLRTAVGRYGLSGGVVADARVDSNWGLPFGNEVFDRVEMILPCGSLLVAVTEPRFWQELFRIVRSGARVGLIIDLPASKSRRVEVGGDEIEVKNAHLLAQEVAREGGFEVEMVLLDVREVFGLETETTKDIRQGIDDFDFVAAFVSLVEFFQITAVKP